jgi:AP-4 complex subunit epsilon-1
LGEYGAPNDPERAYNVITKLVALVDQQTISDSAKGYLLSALAKLCCQTGASLTRDAEVFVRSSASSRNADLQQRALEIQALLSCDAATKAAVLPADASCEDLEVSSKLQALLVLRVLGCQRCALVTDSCLRLYRSIRTSPF